MAKSYRIERINEMIKEILSEIVLGKLKDPRVGLVTITAVRVSADMAVARVFYSVMGDEAEREQTRKGLVSARNFMRKTIAGELDLKNAPELRFEYDDSLERSIAIEKVLREEAQKKSGHQPGHQPGRESEDDGVDDREGGEDDDTRE